jgi:hypothetical protein
VLGVAIWPIMLNAVMLSVGCPECCNSAYNAECWYDKSFMLSISIRSIMLSFVILSVICAECCSLASNTGCNLC